VKLVKENAERILDRTTHYIHSDDLNDILPQTFLGQHLLEQQNQTLQTVNELRQNIEILQGKKQSNNSNNITATTNVTNAKNKTRDLKNVNTAPNTSRTTTTINTNNSNATNISNFTTFPKIVKNGPPIVTQLPSQSKLTNTTATTGILDNNIILDAEKERELQEYIATSYQPHEPIKSKPADEIERVGRGWLLKSAVNDELPEVLNTPILN